MSDVLDSVTIHTVRVPARQGAVNSPERDRPLHKMSDGIHEAWSQQFDAVHKCILVGTTRDGLIAYGESLRGVDPSLLATLAQRFVGQPLDAIDWRRLPLPASRV